MGLFGVCPYIEIHNSIKTNQHREEHNSIGMSKRTKMLTSNHDLTSSITVFLSFIITTNDISDSCQFLGFRHTPLSR
jgi:hypothetical protein